MFCTLFVLLVTLIVIFFTFLGIKYTHWSKRGVPQKSPLHYICALLKSIFTQVPNSEMTNNIYREFPNARYSGFYQFAIPGFLVRDPELIKFLAVKEFNSMMDHRPFMSEDADPMWSRALINLRGDKWRKMRATLSPAFTGNKMKIMFNLMTECGESFAEYFVEHPEMTRYVNMQDVISRYTVDMIATTAFGIKCDSMNDKDNAFFILGRSLTNFSGFWRRITLMIVMMKPNWAKQLGLRIFSDKVVNFFRNIVNESMKTREEKGIVRPDMLQLLMEARKGKKFKEEKPVEHDAGFATVEEHLKPVEEIAEGTLSDEDIVSQALLFFFGGFDNVSLITNFMAYELATNPDVQSKLQQEIDRVQAESNGKLTYECLAKMKYMDMVVTETLRKWPTLPATDRYCEKSVIIPPVTPDEKPVHLEKGDLVIFPIHAIHYDEQYYPNPEVFDPERFNDENKSKITPYIYLPFGVGPRNCIGSRYALLKMKIVMYHLLSKFTLEVTDKTEVPLKLEAALFNTKPKNPVILHLTARNGS